MGVESLLPTPVINAETIRALRIGDDEPCEEGLKAGLLWIGNRSLSLEEAINEARTKRSLKPFVGWALTALGYGDGSGDGSGDGYGYGSGDGSGYGSGDGEVQS